MQLSRKQFIRTAGLGVSFSLADWGKIFARQPLSKAPFDSDESYWQNVRQNFPLTREWTYLNNGTFGPSPYPVIEAVHKGMADEDQLGNYGGYEATIPKIAKFVGVDESEIVLTRNVTEGINIACWGLPLKPGDEVIVTTHEHVGNAVPWLNRQKADGIVIKAYTPALTADETLSRISDLINHKTRVIATPHIPCTQGQVLPVKEICQLAKDKGLYALIDGAHGAGMMPLDLHDMGCDTYASCCHKWMLGPKGTGFLYVSKHMQDIVKARYGGGGTQTGDWNVASSPITDTLKAETAHRYFGGTQASSLYKGVNAAIDFIETIGIGSIHSRIKSLGKYTQDRLLELGDRIELLTPTEERSRCAVNGFRIKGADYQKVYNKCVDAKIRIRSVAENGLNSLRVSTHIYNNHDDVDRLMDVLRNV
jgi:selenocysteine lyase/cysteine desulfurase